METNYIEWLNKENESKWVKRALTDSSYKNFVAKGIGKNDSKYEETEEIKDNMHLAILGDALIKVILSEHFLDKTEFLTNEKSKYESDKFLVEKVAKNYDLLKYIHKDINDDKMPDDYNYDSSPGKNRNRHKYIATCVEAVIAAIYKETNDINIIREIVLEWTKL